PCPVITSTQRRPAAREPDTKPWSARCASGWVIPCRSSRASIARRPRRSRSAVARSTPANWSSGGGAGGGERLAGALAVLPATAATRSPLGGEPPPCPPPRAQEVPAILVARDHLTGMQHDDVGVRQKVERRGRARAGREHQRAGLGDACEGRGQRHGVVSFGATAADLQERALIPRDSIEARI